MYMVNVIFVCLFYFIYFVNDIHYWKCAMFLSYGIYVTIIGLVRTHWSPPIIKILLAFGIGNLALIISDVGLLVQKIILKEAFHSQFFF